MLFSRESYLAEVQVTDNQIRDYYEDHAADYHKEQEVRARHILFGVKEDAPEADVAKVRAEAETVLAEAKRGKDFTELARQYSKIPRSVKTGEISGFSPAAEWCPSFPKPPSV